MKVFITGTMVNIGLIGAGSNDTFNFSDLFGKDTITDLTAGAAALYDTPRLTLGTAFETLIEVMILTTQVSSGR